MRDETQQQQRNRLVGWVSWLVGLVGELLGWSGSWLAGWWVDDLNKKNTYNPQPKQTTNNHRPTTNQQLTSNSQQATTTTNTTTSTTTRTSTTTTTRTITTETTRTTTTKQRKQRQQPRHINKHALVNESVDCPRNEKAKIELEMARRNARSD